MHQEICIVNRGYFEYSTCSKCLFVDTGRITTLVKENPRLRFLQLAGFSLSNRKKSLKVSTSYEFFPRLVKLLIQNYPGLTVTCSFCMYKVNQIFMAQKSTQRQFPACFSPFFLRFPHVLQFLFPVSSGISHVPSSLSPCFLFQVLLAGLAFSISGKEFEICKLI